jgi:hypothetical protein
MLPLLLPELFKTTRLTPSSEKRQMSCAKWSGRAEWMCFALSDWLFLSPPSFSVLLSRWSSPSEILISSSFDYTACLAAVRLYIQYVQILHAIVDCNGGCQAFAKSQELLLKKAEVNKEKKLSA